jgi:probable F420-dependent oxidoreductase
MDRLVKIGIVMFATEEAVAPDELAVMVEERGFESLWFADHTHIPTSRETPWPGGDDLPRAYTHIYDPFVALAAAGAVTSRVLLGTGVCLVAQRDPIITAKAVASLDTLSAGRAIFGVGVGWNREEMRNHGIDPRTRAARLRESVEAMRAIWTQDEAEYHGRFIDFDPIWSWPKPVQPGGPPVVVGGNTAKTLARVAVYGDEWMPNRVDIDALRSMIADLQRLAGERGRPPIPVSAFGYPATDRVLDVLGSLGVHRSVLYLPTVTRDAAERQLDDWAERP